MDHKKVAGEILEAAGGIDNIISSTHCATRLRLEVRNQDLVDTAKIKTIKAVKGHFVTDGQNQFIIGATDVSNVYDEFAELTRRAQAKNKAQSTIQETKQAYRKKNKLSAGIKVISDIFVPIIPIVVAGGLLMCITAFLTTPGFVSPDKSIVELVPSLSGIVGFLSHLSGIPFTFLPVLIGFSATKKFGGTPLLGATLGLCMVGGSLINPASTAGVDIPVWEIFGMHVQQIGYHSTVLPILAASYILAKVEIFGRKKIRNVLNFYVPFMALVITAFITFMVIGPVLRTTGFMLTDALVWLYNTTGVFGGIVLGLLYAPMVITGMHHTFIPVETQLVADIAKTGGTFILPVAAMSNVALGASSLAIAHIYRQDKELKNEAFSSGFTSILGVSEPALFGINLKYKYAFISALCGSATGSAFFALIKLRAISMGAGGLLGLLCYRPGDLPVYCLGMMISITIAFVLTHILARTSLNKNSELPC